MRHHAVTVDHKAGVAVLVVQGPALADLRRAVDRALNTDERTPAGSWLYELANALNPNPVPEAHNARTTP